MQDMQKTPAAERIHIGIYGRRNVGKSSLINAITGQKAALVSEVAGTTADPVYKKMEFPPLGPVVFVDTAGLDDRGELGEKRVEAAFETLARIDLVLFVLQPGEKLKEVERKLISRIRDEELPVIVVLNKTDLIKTKKREEEILSQLESELKEYGVHGMVAVSACSGAGLDALRQEVLEQAPLAENRFIVRDLIFPERPVLLVIPIDIEAPKGRLILPQVQTLREILDADAGAVMVKAGQLPAIQEELKGSPQLVICDSSVVGRVAEEIPDSVPLTTFSILFARYKGELGMLARGAEQLHRLRAGDRVLISEACSHHPVEDDIAREKIPAWLSRIAHPDLRLEWCAGSDFPSDLGEYKLIIHCGGCMLTRREMLCRLEKIRRDEVPVTNFGMIFASACGILSRVLAPLGFDLENIDQESTSSSHLV